MVILVQGCAESQQGQGEIAEMAETAEMAEAEGKCTPPYQPYQLPKEVILTV